MRINNKTLRWKLFKVFAILIATATIAGVPVLITPAVAIKSMILGLSIVFVLSFFVPLRVSNRGYSLSFLKHVAVFTVAASMGLAINLYYFYMLYYFYIDPVYVDSNYIATRAVFNSAVLVALLTAALVALCRILIEESAGGAE